jgi:hypothetical protein
MNIKELRIAIEKDESILGYLLEAELDLHENIVKVLCNLDNLKSELAGRT